MKLYTIKTKFLEKNTFPGNRLRNCDEVIHIDRLSDTLDLKELSNIEPSLYSGMSRYIDSSDVERIKLYGETVMDCGLICHDNQVSLSNGDRYYIGVVDIDHEYQSWIKSILRDINIESILK